MQTNLTGKQINQFAQSRNDIPGYFGDRYYPFGYYPKSGKHDKRVNGEFISKKYKDIAALVLETKGTVYVQPDCIHVTYTGGNFTIQRDLLTDTFLLPLLKTA